MQRGTKTVIVLIVAAALFATGTLYVAVVVRESAIRRLVLVRATVDVTTDAPPSAAIPADFGPHCAPARFLPSGALEIESDELPIDATGVVFLEYRAVGPFSTIGDGIVLLFFRPSDNNVEVVSSVNPARVLFTIHRVGVSPTLIIVDDLAYQFGASFSRTFTTPVTVEQSTWNVDETFSGIVVGPVESRVVAPSLCA